MLKYALTIGTLLILISCASASPYYVAQGDSALIPFKHDNGTCWYFGSSAQTPDLYDTPSVAIGNTTFCKITTDESSTMQGWYDLVYTYPSKLNNITPFKDVRWSRSGLQSALSSSSFLDESGKQSQTVKSDLLNLIKTNGIDNYELSTISIDKPYITITRIEAKTDVIEHIQGYTNLQNGTTITIKVDEMERYALHDSANYTFQTEVIRPDNIALGTWDSDMMLPLQDMYPGWHNVNVYADDVTASVRFPIYQYWTPVPTPTQYINYFGNGSIKPDIVTVEVTVPVYINQTKYIQLTATPTPDITDVFGNTINYPYKPETTYPDSIGFVLLAMLAAVIVLTKGAKK
ncbi:MAG: hypothetical protein PHV83_07815 [Bacteroidales bacterium]|nr:hypothetical protein [Bacteroidales bacterium]